MPTSFICQACGIEAPTKHTAYMQNIGALVMRYHKTMQGNLCKRCHHKYFWKFTATNLTLGWWGTISAIVTPIFVINNVARYLAASTMPKVPADAKKPALTQEIVAKIEKGAPQLVQRLNSGESLETLAPDVARFAGVTPGEVVVYVQWLASQQRQRQPYVPPPKSYGFPVQPAAPSFPVQPLPALPVDDSDANIR